MKQSDIFTVIIVATVGTVAAAILCNLLLGDPNAKSVTFKTITVIEASLAEPDPEVFNPEAVNPTVEVYVGDCVDQDQNGTLDEAELTACGRSDGTVEINNNVTSSPVQTTVNFQNGSANSQSTSGNSQNASASSQSASGNSNNASGNTTTTTTTTTITTTTETTETTEEAPANDGGE